jgi:uncharacterized protein involved in exopolysaccharide biosynthesis
MTEVEIDFIDAIKMLWQKKFFIVGFVFLIVVLSIIYSVKASKSYKAYVSFFVNSSSSSSLMGYASMLGVGMPSNMENLIKNILHSDSIKIQVANKLESRFKEELDDAIKSNRIKDTYEHRTEFVLANLNFHSKLRISINKNHLFVITYISTDPKLCKDVLDLYVFYIQKFNESLGLSSKRNLMTIVDSPREPLLHFRPRKRFNVIFSFFISLLLACFWVFSQRIILYSFFSKDKR